MGIVAALAGFFAGWLLVQASRRISNVVLRWVGYALSCLAGLVVTVLVTRSDAEAQQAGSTLLILLLLYPIAKKLFIKALPPSQGQQ